MTVQNDNQEFIKERKKKAEIIAQDTYELEKLQGESQYLLECSIEEEKDAYVFSYYIKGHRALKEIREEDILIRYIALIDIANLYKLHNEFEFSLDPLNLYYDINAKVRVAERDICDEENADRTELFIAKYKSVIGSIMQKRYSYEDYMHGGMDLLRKNRFLNQIYDAKDIEEIKDILLKKYTEKKAKREKSYRLVHKRKYAAQIIIGVIMTITTVLLSLSSLYAYFVLIPEMRAVIRGNQSYYESDYIGVIDDLKELRISQMDIYTKCILATAYVKSENLTLEQKENILSLINITGNEKYINYWIELGRGNEIEAENIAMQLSNDELLLYAYMKERNQLEADESIDGEEKAQRLEELQSKIEKLAKEYSE